MRRSGPPQMVCTKCGSQMRLDDKDELRRGVFQYWYECDKCNIGCTVNESTGEIKWDDSAMEDDLPF